VVPLTQFTGIYLLSGRLRFAEGKNSTCEKKTFTKAEMKKLKFRRADQRRAKEKRKKQENNNLSGNAAQIVSKLTLAGLD